MGMKGDSMKDIVVLINGRAQSGKDTFVKYVKQYIEEKESVTVSNRSRTDPVVDVLNSLWWDGKKTDEVRQLMKTLVEFGDCTGKNKTYYETCLDILSGILFFHVREPFYLKQYKEIAQEKGKQVVTLFIHRNTACDKDHQWTDLERFGYDYRVQNNGTLDELQKEAELFADLLLIKLYL